MQVAVEQFRWQRFEGGYRWIDAASIVQRARIGDPKHRDTRFLVPAGTEGRIYQYNPLEGHPTLFREFAGLRPDRDTFEEVFAEFASRYGPLGIGEILARSGPVEAGEPASRWWEEWGRLRQVVRVLDVIESRDAEQLGRMVSVDDQRAHLHLETDGGSAFAWLSDKDTLRTWLWRYALEAPDNIERFCRFATGWVQDQINESLNGRRDGTSVSARVLFSPERNGFGLHLVPASLLAAMWLQCARVLTAGMTFRACEQCGKWFELSPDARRRHTRYCSARCRVAAYRQRSLPNR